jgi:CRISPR/Cas system Type II protein with McrA/HNH and RuvC-like nuclease domain
VKITYIPTLLRAVHEMSLYLLSHQRHMVKAGDLTAEQAQALQALATALRDVQRLLGPQFAAPRPKQSRRRERLFRPSPYVLYEQQGGRCFYCGVALTLRRADHRAGPEGPKRAEIDHTHPVSRGGKDEHDNYHLVRVDCNQHKGMLTGEEFQAALKVRNRNVTAELPLARRAVVPQDAPCPKTPCGHG